MFDKYLVKEEKVKKYFILLIVIFFKKIKQQIIICKCGDFSILCYVLSAIVQISFNSDQRAGNIGPRQTQGWNTKKLIISLLNMN